MMSLIRIDYEYSVNLPDQALKVKPSSIVIKLNSKLNNLSEKDLDNISIQEICKQRGLSRSQIKIMGFAQLD